MIASEYPEAAPYILSDMTISKALYPDAQYGESALGSILTQVDPKYFSNGLNTALEEHFIMGKNLSTGAMAELEVVWEKVGSPGTFKKFVEALRMYY